MAGKKSVYEGKKAPEFLSDEWFDQTEERTEGLTESEIDDIVRKELDDSDD